MSDLPLPNNHHIQQLGLQVLIAFVRAMAADELVDDEVIAIYDGLPTAILSVVMYVNCDEKNIDAVIERVCKFYEKQAGAWAWIVGPLSRPQPDVLTQHLLQHDMYKADEYPGMYFSLDSFEIPLQEIEVKIIEADAQDELYDWVIPLSEAFTPTKDQGEGFRNLNARLPHGPGTAFRHYVGYLQNEPVCSGTLFIHDELAMIHNVATRPAHQRKRFGTAIVLRSLQDAKLAGVKHCFLDSSENGKKVYSRVGFVEYCMQQLYTNRN